MSENLRLKHLNHIICSLEEFNMENLVERCDQSYKVLLENKMFEEVHRFI